MNMTRRKLLGAIGAGGVTALPLAWGAPLTALPGSAAADLLMGSAQSAAILSGRELQLDMTLNATPIRSLDLSGPWKVAQDPENKGKAEGWYQRGPVASAIEQKLPNPLQLAFPGYNGVAWYWRSFEFGDLEHYDDIRIHFEGVDYYAEAWLNSQYLGGNQSALLPFALDGKTAMRRGQNSLVVRIIDACYAKEIDGFRLGEVPGGRQHDNPWEPGFRHFNYGGLLLPVTVQAFRRPWIADAFIRPNVAEHKIDVDLTLVGGRSDEWQATVTPRDGVGPATRKTIPLAVTDAGTASISMSIDRPRLWDVWDGNLYELELAPVHGGTTWRGSFGMREISLQDGRISINGKPILQRSFLYNQIWPGTLGAPYEDLARKDIELARRANANMLRCFSKTPLAATVRAADELGILLQHESLGSWYLQNGRAEDERLGNITQRAVLAYRNHPSLLWWNVLNENSPRVDPKRPAPDPDMTLGPYVLRSVLGKVHSLDPTRPVIANDPIWHDVENVWQPGQSQPSLPLVQDHYYQFTTLENNEDSWQNIRQRGWGQAENPQALYLAVTEWGVNSSPEWSRLLGSYQQSGLPENAEDFSLYRKLHAMNVRHYEESGIKDQGFPTLQCVEQANRDYVAWRYHEQMALYWGDLHSVGHGLTSLEDSGYELSGVVDNWRNPKPVVFDTITELNRPLQINLWVRPSCLYAGEQIAFDATLVNERQRLSAGTYALKLSLLNEQNEPVVQKEYSHRIGIDPIALLVTDALAVPQGAGRYRLVLDMNGDGQQLHAERPVVVFARKPKMLSAAGTLWVWDERAVLQPWLSARSLHARKGDADSVRAGDLMLVSDADASERASIQRAIRNGGRAVILRPELLFHEEPAAGSAATNSSSEHLEPLDGNWKPELRQIGWWGAPSAWGYTRTALALQHPYLDRLPQAKALEAQAEYQRVAPAYTWVMNDPPQNLTMSHAIRESSLAVDMPYSSDLFSLSVGSGHLVLTSLRIAQYLNLDPAADIILENIISELSNA